MKTQFIPLVLSILLLATSAYAEENLMRLTPANAVSFDNCYVMIPGQAEKYSLSDVSNVMGTKHLILYCDLSSGFEADETFGITLYLRSFEGSSYTELKNETALTYLLMSSDHKEKLDFSIPIIPGPGQHSAELYALGDDDQLLSNTVRFSYNVASNKANIKDLVLDKNIYKKGEQAKATVSWEYEELVNKVGSFFLELGITGAGETACIEKQSFEITPYETEKTLEAIISSDCKDPKVDVSLLQGEKTLDTQTFSFKSPAEEQDGPIDEPGTDGSSDSTPFIIILLIALVAVAILFLKKFKK
jgi:hypothetical protein